MQSKALIVIAAMALIVSAVGLLLFVFSGGFGGKGQGMGSQEIPRSLGLALFIVPLVVVFSVLGYSLIFPSLHIKKPEPEASKPSVEKGETIYNAVLRILNDDEKTIIETLADEGGTMLQKDIRWKTGLSRVKTHRILFRLAKRGIVSAEKHYNTNKITLADWLTKRKTNQTKPLNKA
jgi:hypothetical protein